MLIFLPMTMLLDKWYHRSMVLRNPGGEHPSHKNRETQGEAASIIILSKYDYSMILNEIREKPGGRDGTQRRTISSPS